MLIEFRKIQSKEVNIRTLLVMHASYIEYQQMKNYLVWGFVFNHI